MSTTVTIELTDEMVAALRAWQRQPVPEGESSFHIPTVMATLAANQLPPPPVRVNIELPGPLADRLGKQHTIVPDDPATDLWRIVEQAVRRMKEAGVPLT